MSLVITILILTLFVAVIIFAVVAVFLAVMTVVKSGRATENTVTADGTVEVYFRRPKAKVKPEKKSEKAAKPGKKTTVPSVEIPPPAYLSELPAGYHLLADIKITLPEPIKYKGKKIAAGTIDNLLIGPRRLYILEAVNGSRAPESETIKATVEKTRLVSAYLKQKLAADFQVCGWLVADDFKHKNNSVKVVSKLNAKEAIVKHERYPQGKTKVGAADRLAEIISTLKLSAWEKAQ